MSDDRQHELPEVDHGTSHGLWSVVSKHGEKISSLREDLSGLKATVRAGFGQLDQTLVHMDRQMTNLTEIAQRPPEKADIKGWFTIGISFAFLLGALLMAVIAPIQQATGENSKHIADIQQTSTMFHEFVGRSGERWNASYERDEVMRERILLLEDRVRVLEGETAHAKGVLNRMKAGD